MAKQLGLKLTRPTWGRRRKGAGRVRAAGRRRGVKHTRRPEHDSRHLEHVTMRARDGVPSLRGAKMFSAVRAALSMASKADFRVVQFSVQRDHVHLVVEADDRVALSSGMNGLSVRCARGINRVARRQGSVWADRYHCEPKTNPTMVRYLLSYVLGNFKKHDPTNAASIDPCSSAPWFGGFRESLPVPREPSPVRPARTWLGSIGWLKAGGPLSIHDAPARSD
jgi:putative transposase